MCVSVCVLTEEGSKEEDFTFGKVVPTSLPTVINAYSKKTYAYYYDETSDSYTLFYTSNGKTFSKVADCNTISTEEVNSPIKDIIDDIEDALS